MAAPTQTGRAACLSGEFVVLRVQTRPTKSFCAIELAAHGIQVFFPLLQLPEYAEQRRRIVPLFPGYLFARADLTRDSYAVLWAPGVKTFVGAGATPSVLDDEVVAFLVRRATPDGLLARAGVSGRR